MGAAIQDHVDRVVAALSKKLHYPFGLLEAEVKVIIESALAHDVLNLSSYIYIYIYIKLKPLKFSQFFTSVQ